MARSRRDEEEAGEGGLGAALCRATILRTAAHRHGVRLRKRLVQTDKKRRRKEASGGRHTWVGPMGHASLNRGGGCERSVPPEDSNHFRIQKVEYFFQM
jgi:hypothetical protein